MTISAGTVAPARPRFTADVIGAVQYGRRVVVYIGSPIRRQPGQKRTAPPVTWTPVLIINERDNGLRVKGKILKPWAQPLAISELSIYNLSPDSRGRIEGRTSFPVRVMAGYGSTLRLVGTIMAAQCSSVFDPTTGDVITKIEGFRGGAGLLETITASYGIGTPLADVALDLAGQVATIGPAAARTIEAAAKGRTYQWGKSTAGSTLDLLAEVMTDIGAEWAIVDGALAVAEKDKTTQELFLLSPQSGLIGSPVPDGQPAPGKLYFLRAKSLLNATFAPGAKCLLQSAACAGQYKCWDVGHEFDSFQGEWYSSLQLRPVPLGS